MDCKFPSFLFFTCALSVASIGSFSFPPSPDLPIVIDLLLRIQSFYLPTPLFSKADFFGAWRPPSFPVALAGPLLQ